MTSLSQRPPFRTFTDYAAAGFTTELLPILPPDASISPRSKQLENLTKKRGKVPGKQTRDGWVGFARWSQHHTSEDDLQKWGWWPCGVGLQGRLFPAIDIDVDEPSLSQQIGDLAAELLGPSPVRTSGSARSLRAYRGAGLKKRRLEFRLIHGDGGVADDEPAAVHAIEFLGDGQQYVVQGIHPKALIPYAWQDGRSPAEWGAQNLTEVTAESVSSFFSAARALIESFGGVISPGGAGANGRASDGAVDQDSLVEPRPGATARLLARCPNELEARDDWLRVCRAAKAAGGEDAYEAFEEWSLKWSVNTAQGTRELWDSCLPPHKIGWPYLASWAASVGVSSAAEEFDAVEVGQDGAEPAAAMFKRYVWVEENEGYLDLADKVVCSEKNFNARNWRVGPTWNSQKRASAVFLSDGRRRRTVRGVTYRPGGADFISEENGECVNIWTPGRPLRDVPHGDEDVRIWTDHVAYLVPDPVERETLLNWFAWVVQRPAEKPNWGVVLGGLHGIGKSYMLEPIRAALGRHNVSEVTAHELASPYTDYLDRKKLFIVEEIMQFERKELMQRIKGYLAAPPHRIRINPKFGKQFEVPNVLAGIFFTNHENALAIEKGERRFFVLWSNAKPLPAARYEALKKFYDNCGTDAAARWLLARDLAGFDAHGRAPSTAAHEDMRKAARPRLAEWVEDGIADRSDPFQPDLVALQDLFSRMPSDAYRPPHKPSVQALSAALKSAGSRRLGENDRRVALGRAPAGCSAVGGKTDLVRMFSLRNHDRYAGMSTAELAAEFWRQRIEAEAVDVDDVFSAPGGGVAPGAGSLQGVAAMRVVGGEGGH